jgi:urea transport system permease protein
MLLGADPEQAARIAAGDSDERIAALNEVVAGRRPGAAPFVQACWPTR